MIDQFIGKIIAISGLSLSIFMLYLISVCNEKEIQMTSFSWSEFAPYFTASSFIFLVYSFIEATELIASFYVSLNPKHIYYVSFAASIGMILLMALLLRSVLRLRCINVTLGESVFYGKFGITLIYIAILVLIMDRMKNVSSVYFLLKLVSESLFVAFIPIFAYITIRSIKYTTLIKKGLIIAPPHTLNVFLGVVSSFTIFFMAVLLNAIGEYKLYNMLEIGSFFVFVLVGISYSEAMEELLDIEKHGKKP